MEVKFTNCQNGIIVQVGKSILPGYYTNIIYAQKAADRYIGLNSQVSIERKKILEQKGKKKDKEA